MKASSLRRGGSPGYTVYHTLLALRILRSTRVGRPQLERILGLTEASVRTLLRRLRELGLAEGHASGHRLTSQGEALLDTLRDLVTLELPGLEDLGLSHAVVVPYLEPPSSLVDVYRIRDYAVRASCKSPIVVGGIEDGKPFFPGLPGELEERLSRALLQVLPPGINRGVIMTSSSECLPSLMTAAIEAILELCARG